MRQSLVRQPLSLAATAAKPGDMMEATGEVTRAGGRLIYVRGMITANGKPALSFTSVITKISRRP